MASPKTVENEGIHEGNPVFVDDATSFMNAGNLILSGSEDFLAYSTFANTGSIAVGAGTTLYVNNNSSSEPFNNTGVISVASGGTIEVGGSLALASLGSITGSGETDITGTLDLGGGTISLTAGGEYGNLRLDGMLTNGTVIENGATLTFGNNSTLSGITLEGPLESGGASITLANSLTVETASGGTPGLVDVSQGNGLTIGASQTLDNVTIQGATTKNVTSEIQIYAAPSTLTLGAHANLVQTGGTEQISAQAVGEEFINNGLLSLSGGSFLDQADKLANAGTITLAGGETFTVVNDTNTLSNTGLIEALANSGTVTLITAATNTTNVFTDLTGTTLTDGAFKVDDGTTLDLSIGKTITALGGAITLNGPNSALLQYGTSTYNQSIESTLGTILNTGTLALLNGRSWTGTLAVGDAGLLQLQGGVFTAPSLTVSGALLGFGTEAAAITNTGTIEAKGGTLTLMQNPGTAGLLRIDAASGLDLLTSSAAAATFNGIGADLILSTPAGYTGTLTSVAAGDTLTLIGDVATSASTNGTTLTVALQGGGTQTYTLSAAVPSLREAVTLDGLGDTNVVFYRDGAAVLPTSISFGQAHTGDTVTQFATLTNSDPADGYSETLDGQISATGSFTATGSIALLAAGQANGSAYTITEQTGAGGQKNGVATVALQTDGTGVDGLAALGLASDTINLSGAVFNYATASVAPAPVVFANHHVGDTVTQAITVSNTAVTGAYSENLDANFSGASGSISDMGTMGELAAGANSSALTVTLATGAAGAISGTATLGLVSDGSTIDTLGTTALAAQMVAISGNVYNYASAALAPFVDFGVVHVGDSVMAALTLSNTAPAAYSDTLDAQFSGATGAVSDTGTISALAAGSSSSALGLSLNTATAGTLSGTASVALVSDGTGEGLGLTNFGSLAVDATGTVDNYATAALSEVNGGGSFTQSSNNYTFDFGTLTVGSDPATASFSVANIAAGVADSLQGSFQANTTTGFTNTGFVNFSGVGAGLSASAGTITVDTGTVGLFQETITLSASGANSSGYLGALPSETLTIEADVIVCFREGTHITTPTGERCVETLRIGDLVTTASGASEPIRWLGHRTVDCRMHSRQEEANPIRIARHAFGENKPTQDLYVSPAHCICVDRQGEVLIPAYALANGSTITQIETDQVTYWHVELDHHDILIANGLPAESYIDMGNRQFFVENGVVALDVSPDAGRLDPHLRTPADFCRPLVTDGPLLDAVRAELGLQAEALGWTLAHSPLADLHLDISGHRVDPIMRGLTARFAVPAGVGDVWLVSTRSRPSDVVGGDDGRYLGVCLAELTIDDGFDARSLIALDDPLLSTGFNLFEDGWRWTAGRAYLPAALWDKYQDGFFLRVHLTSPALPTWVMPPDSALKITSGGGLAAFR